MEKQLNFKQVMTWAKSNGFMQLCNSAKKEDPDLFKIQCKTVL